jgi:hypothetical protein
LYNERADSIPKSNAALPDARLETRCLRQTPLIKEFKLLFFFLKSKIKTYIIGERLEYAVFGFIGAYCGITLKF